MKNDHGDKKNTDLITEEDRAVFAKFCKSVTPLKSTERITSRKKRSLPIGQKQSICRHQNHTSRPFFHFSERDIHLLHSIRPVTSNDVLHYQMNRLHRNVQRQIKRGKINVEASLDLHHHTAHDALEYTHLFLQTCIKRKLKIILIIHGKGNLSQNGFPVIKSLLNEWLRTQPAVLAFHSAHHKDGGTGALYVLLKLNKE
jgi:DNA-nicking Smr family endonuclease